MSITLLQTNSVRDCLAQNYLSLLGLSVSKHASRNDHKGPLMHPWKDNHHLVRRPSSIFLSDDSKQAASIQAAIHLSIKLVDALSQPRLCLLNNATLSVAEAAGFLYKESAVNNDRTNANSDESRCFAINVNNLIDFAQSTPNLQRPLSAASGFGWTL